MKAPSLVWFRLDLRLTDNPALAGAQALGGPIIPVFIYAPEEEGDWPPGGASRWWLHQSLLALADTLEKTGSRLIIRRGSSLENLLALARETGAQTLFWNRRYEPALIERDRHIKTALLQSNLKPESRNSALLFEPWTVANKTNRPFQVFTPFWRHCLTLDEPPPPLPGPRSLLAPKSWPPSQTLESLNLQPRTDWAGGIRNAWQPGETGAQANLQRFLERAFADYTQQRNRPDVEGTSRLSPHLHFGEIGPRQVWHGLEEFASRRRTDNRAWRDSQFLSELGWREFAHHLLYHFPHTPSEPLRPEFARFPWRQHPPWLRAWQKGQTGYPIVDAGLRELWTTGWMHNRVRMIAASFLVKDLLLDWRAGARWFWDTLVDADLASNTLGWQWTAGCGADAAPFFRIFNPVIQGQKFDPQGHYLRRWIPELARLPNELIHQPWTAAPAVLKSAGLQLDRHYPAPIVSHAIAREVALEALARVKKPSTAQNPIP